MASPADMARIAKAEIGYRESGSNYTKYNKDFGSIPGYPHAGFGYPWCASFMCWVAKRVGLKPNVDYPRTAGCEVGVAWFKRNGRWHRTPAEGDFVYYGPGGGTHVELVVRVTSTTITTVGGNTSGSLGGQYYNGNGVYQKVISRSNSRIAGYGRPKYSKTSPPVPGKTPYPGRVLKLRSPLTTGSDVKSVQQQLVKLGYELDIDGAYGPHTRAAVVDFQKKSKITADGEVGPDTWGKLFP
ncbi:peptidoglycan-binding protein [Actinomadura rubrisoli]|nr:peptidoglycan-binding protein [Actinomadura rubrisoli]